MANQQTEKARYCALIQLGKSSDMQRIASAVPPLVAMIERWSKGEMELLCRSNDGQLFGYLFKSAKPEAMLRAEFESSGATNNTDSFIVFEVGEKFTGIGFSRAWTWLQHH